MASLNDVAVALGVTPRRVLQLVKLGMPRERRGVYDLKRCCTWYMNFVEESLPGLAPQRGPAHLDFLRETARLTAERADKLALDNEHRRGELLEAPVVARTWHVLHEHTRRCLLRLPDMVAPTIAELSDAAAIEAVLRDAVHRVMADVADFTPTREELDPDARPARAKRRH
ncbi:MAG: hypothetical protein AMXMBFR8_26860 [Nevskiales bacterium]